MTQDIASLFSYSIKIECKNASIWSAKTLTKINAIEFTGYLDTTYLLGNYLTDNISLGIDANAYLYGGYLGVLYRNIIYAENGAGKTTLSDIFRSLRDNNTKIIVRDVLIDLT